MPGNLALGLVFAMSTPALCQCSSLRPENHAAAEILNFMAAYFGVWVKLIQRPVLSLYSISVRRLPALLFRSN